MLFAVVLVILLQSSHGSSSSECFDYGLQYAGEALNTPEQDKTPSPEACQLFCQTVIVWLSHGWMTPTAWRTSG